MQFTSALLSVSLLACVLSVTAAPAPQEPDCDSTTTSSPWGEPTSTSAWGGESTSTSVWEEPTSTSVWGEPTSTSVWGEPTTSPWGQPTTVTVWGEPTTITVTYSWAEPTTSTYTLTPSPTTIISTYIPSSTWSEPAPSPSASSGTGSTGSCTAGSAMCCQSVTSAGSASQELGGILNGLLGTITGLVGIGCSAIPVLGSECTDTVACCSPQTLGEGLINLGCIPIAISL